MSEARAQYKANPFQKATKERSKLRMAIDGPSGSGKTFTALIFATALADGGRVAVIDTERGSASKYADMFDFDVLELSEYAPEQYIAGITAAEKAGYDVIVLDSLSHAWEGKGGVLEMHDNETRRSRSGNSWTAWRDVTPKHRSLVDAMLQSTCHIIATMRTKTAHIQTTDSKGKTVIQKVGMAPIQRAGMEYEFDIVADIDLTHTMVVGKSRCFSVTDDVVVKPNEEWFGKVKAWLTTGAEPQERKVPTPTITDERAAPWTTTQDWGKFWAYWKGDKGLTEAEVHAAAGVESMKDYTGTKDELRAAVDAYIAAQIKAQPEQELPAGAKFDAAPQEQLDGLGFGK